MAATLHASENFAAVPKARSERRRALVVPREHGAWGLLLVPLVTGAGVGLHHASHVMPPLPLSIAALSLFWLRTPLESLIGTSAMKAQSREEVRLVRMAVILLGVVAAVTLGMLLWGGRNAALWPLGMAAAACFVMATVLNKAGRPFRMLSEVIGTIGLTAGAPAAYYVITGRFNSTAWVLWLANILFAGNQIHYVQLRIHAARIQGFSNKLAKGWAFATGQALMAAILIFACAARLMPAIALLAFAPLLFRGWFYFVQKPAPLIVRRLGWNELKQAAAFCVLFIAAYWVAK